MGIRFVHPFIFVFSSEIHWLCIFNERKNNSKTNISNVYGAIAAAVSYLNAHLRSNTYARPSVSKSIVLSASFPSLPHNDQSQNIYLNKLIKTFEDFLLSFGSLSRDGK